MNKIKALIEAGEKATQGEWIEPKHSFDRLAVGHRTIASFQGYQEHSRQEEVQIENDNNKEFCKIAANARAEIKALYEAADKMAKALEDIQSWLSSMMQNEPKIDQALAQYKAVIEAAQEKTE